MWQKSISRVRYGGLVPCHGIILSSLEDSGLIWDISLSFPVQDPCSGRGLEVLSCGRSNKVLLAWISSLAAGQNSTSHGDLPGLFEEALRFFCPAHSSQITDDTPDCLDEGATVAVGSPTERSGKLPTSCALTVFTAFTLQLLLQL